MQRVSAKAVREAAHAKGYDFYPKSEWNGRTCALVKRGGVTEWYERGGVTFNNNAAALEYLQSI